MKEPIHDSIGMGEYKRTQKWQYRDGGVRHCDVFIRYSSWEAAPVILMHIRGEHTRIQHG